MLKVTTIRTTFARGYLWRLLLPLLIALCLAAAFLSVTRLQAATNDVTWPTITLTEVESGFVSPVNLVSPKDGTDRLFVVERGGLVQIIENGERLATPFLDISDRITDACPECGLLGLAFPPDFAESGYFFANYTHNGDLISGDTGDPNGSNDTVIARYFVTDNPNIADSENEDPILQINQPGLNHNGGHMLFGPDGYLYIAMGDGGDSGYGNSQDMESLLGKILRIEVGATGTYTIPDDNPFAGVGDLRGEIWAMGLRNPWRFGFDPDTGDLYVADVGQITYEEINYIAAAEIGNGGMNFGWKLMEGNACYPPNGPQNCARTGLTEPVITYAHTSDNCSVTGGHVYHAPNHAPIYLYGDYCSGRLWGMQLDGANWVSTELEDFPFRITSFGDDAAGNVYIVSYAGTVYRIHSDDPITGLSAANSGPVEVNNAVAFTATATGGTVLAYTWDFGDGNSSTGVTTTHTYMSSGVFTATVVAANAANSISATTTVYVGDAVVNVRDNQYEPADVMIPPGGNVVWVLRQGTHSVTADDGSFEQPLGSNWPPFIQSFASAASTVDISIAYHCTLHAALGMIGTVIIQQDPEPITGLVASNNGPKAVGESVTFSATVTGGTEIGYAWNFGDGGTGSGITTTHAYTQAGTFTATVVASNAISIVTATTTVQITGEAPSPITGLNASNDGPKKVGDPVGFTASVASGTAISYVWDFGDGSSGSGNTPSHIYSEAGVYTATVTATNAANSVSDTTTVYIGDAVVDVTGVSTYVPRDITVPVGSTVIWVLRGGTHSVTEDAGRFEQPLGSSWPPFVQTFTEPDRYPYHCTIHGLPGGIGMAGSVTVTGASQEQLELHLPNIRDGEED